ncbi:hypothetical protein PMG71_05530 [Roseofilum sp. BLCC_M154]|uniref:Tetratricopeptide repeat protein n=1 Tax=Roseofilum acuticapitatum BLCC-M154 TaxID=3022444 RepID=A0ABT7APQ8_9CYAN|nr:hypothetical protein [Roseofilum acuticapitatum]MDJ1168880.1 hypothetical protein [Roseofilum acuticapitatum BLCC-M154]
MEIWVISLFLIGLGLAGFGTIWTMVISFSESIFWGISYLFLPLIGAILFVYLKWHKKTVRISFLTQVFGVVLMIGSGIFMLVQNWSFQNLIARWTPQRKSEPAMTQLVLNYPTEPALSAEPPPSYEPSISLKSYTSRSQFKRYMEVGYQAFDVGDYHTALINFEQALKERPDNIYAQKAFENTNRHIQQNSYTHFMKAGYQAFEAKNYAIALQNFQTALQYRPGDSYALKAIDNVQDKINR